MPIKNQLRELRFEYKMDQNDFALFLGVNKTLYNKWERQNGQPNLEWAMKIAMITKRPIESFIVLVQDELQQWIRLLSKVVTKLIPSAYHVLSKSAGGWYVVSSIMPFHQRLAELWVTNQRKGLSEEETQELYICLKANCNYCYERAYLENLSLLASMTNDTDWLYEISLEVDNHENKI